MLALEALTDPAEFAILGTPVLKKPEPDRWPLAPVGVSRDQTTRLPITGGSGDIDIFRFVFR